MRNSDSDEEKSTLNAFVHVDVGRVTTAGELAICPSKEIKTTSFWFPTTKLYVRGYEVWHWGIDVVVEGKRHRNHLTQSGKVIPNASAPPKCNCEI